MPTKAVCGADSDEGGANYCAYLKLLSAGPDFFSVAEWEPTHAATIHQSSLPSCFLITIRVRVYDRAATKIVESAARVQPTTFNNIR